jgi:hypothetical protein
MTVSDHIHQLLTQLLEEKQVVVWYDDDGALRDLAARFHAPNCRVVSASDSVLQARREADRVFRGLNDSDNPELRNANLLIYCPRQRAKQDDDRCQDPFEVFAVCGVTFGDKPNEKIQSLARQAMPDRTAEIDRIFDEGEPTLAMLDGLKAGMSYPLVKDCLGTDSPLDVAARVLCVGGTIDQLAVAPGAVDEVLRLLQAEYGYEAPSRTQKSESKLQMLAHYVLLSEFAFDLDGPVDKALGELAVASEQHKERIFALCDRMRRSDDTREGYIAAAQHVETQLGLRALYKDRENIGQRDTFPFEERNYLDRIKPLIEAGKLDEAGSVIADRRHSIWSSLGDRAVLWKTAERCVELLQAIEACRPHLPGSGKSVTDHIRAYTEREWGLWRVDRQQRLVEQAAAACAEDAEVEPLVEVCRRRYREIAEDAQSRFLYAVQQHGWPPDDVTRQTQTFDRHIAPVLQEGTKVVYFLVDSMRYEMARDLGVTFEEIGAVKVEAVAGVLPAVTALGMAALMPGADGTFKLVGKGDTLVPSVADTPLPRSNERMDFLRDRYGDRFAELTLGDVLSFKDKKLSQKIGSAELLVVRTYEIDNLGETTNLYHARKHMSGILGELFTVTKRLAKLGFGTFVYAADHGHVLLPEVAPGDVLQKPTGEWLLEKRRSLLGRATGSAKGVLVFKAERLGINGPVADMAIAGGFKVFMHGAGYFHEGLSLQECLVPVIVLNVSTLPAEGVAGTDLQIRYRSDTFTSRVIGLKLFFQSLFREPLVLRLEAYDATGPKATLVGEAADCDARDPNTGLVTLLAGQETQVPLKVGADFEGKQIEIRAIDATGPGVVLARLQLKNAVAF